MTDSNTPMPITQDLSCIHCGYNLRALLPTSLCPECGTLIQTTLHRFTLTSVDARWFSAIRIGIILFAASALVAPLGAWTDWLLFRSTALEISILFAHPLLLWWSAHLLAEKPTTAIAPPRDSWNARLTRLLANLVLIVSLTTSVDTMNFLLAPSTSFPTYSPLFHYLNIIKSFLVALLFWFLAGTVAAIAHDIGERPLQQQFNTLRWIWPIIHLIPQLMSLVLFLTNSLGFSYNPTSTLTYALGIPNIILLIIAFLWTSILAIRLYTLLGRYRRTAPPPSPGSPPPWLPQTALKLFGLLTRITRVASYHGPENSADKTPPPENP